MVLAIVLLVFAAILIFLGFAERVLDRLYLTDKAALLVIALMILGTFWEITLPASPPVNINIGGFVIPLFLILYVLIRADERREKINGLLGILFTGLAIFGTALLLRGFGHGPGDILEPVFVFSIIGAAAGYAMGRSRRGAFISALGGFIIYDLIVAGRILFTGLSGNIHLGGAGILDSSLLAGFLALALVEIFGETLESFRPGGGRDNEV